MFFPLPRACASALAAMLRVRADDRPSCRAFDAFVATFGLVTFDDDFFDMVFSSQAGRDLTMGPPPSDRILVARTVMRTTHGTSPRRHRCLRRAAWQE